MPLDFLKRHIRSISSFHEQNVLPREARLYGSIELACIEAASRIVAWHLNESRRFYGELALPKELADAVRLDKWLIEHCRQKNTLSLNKNHIRQYGPLRDGMRLNIALKELTDLDRLSITEHGKGQLISVNPKLIKDK